MAIQNDQPTNNQDSQRKALNKRLESISWALFIIMIGSIWLVPKVPEGIWLIGTGLIMLGLNGARYLNGIKMSGFTIVLGILALAFGMSDFLHVDLPLIPILLILIGAHIIIKPLIEKKRT